MATFLSARWDNLCLLTYAVPPELLQPRLPPGLTLDLRDGQAFVSLVAFQFADIRVLGLPVPGYRHFPEMNLRFYVRQGTERGVVFIREFVPQRVVAGMARVLYNEPYLATPMRESITGDDQQLTASYGIQLDGRWHTVRVTGQKPTIVPPETSDEHFFKEHRWGFGRDRRGHLVRYGVTHPVWAVHPVSEWHLDFDWQQVYGSQWAFLQAQAPYSVVLAVGSPITVSMKL
ncbi:MAG: DUF2071 domain-containing protein [Candidatus Sericytochromatia bacterium]|nr:DUF2071 domain-containing protein [Candidatus Sericytochromatia bacterium]